MIGKIVNNKIILPPNNDGNKFNVNLNSEWLEANGFREMTEAEITTANTSAKIVRQAAKSNKLKQAENEYFALIDTINNAESLNVLYSDNSTMIMQKANALSMTKKSYYGMLLQNAMHEIEISGGSWHDLPSQPHNMGE